MYNIASKEYVFTDVNKLLQKCINMWNTQHVEHTTFGTTQPYQRGVTNSNKMKKKEIQKWDGEKQENITFRYQKAYIYA